MTAPAENPGPTLQDITEELNKEANKHRKARDDMNNGADIWAMKRDRYQKEIRAKRTVANAVKQQLSPPPSHQPAHQSKRHYRMSAGPMYNRLT